jgi:CRISPR-associated protein Cmr2
MNFDWCSTLSDQQHAGIEKIILREKEIKEEKDKREKAWKEKLANEERIKLLLPNAHHTYHLIAVKDKTSADNFRSIWQKESLHSDLGENISAWGLNNLLRDNLFHPAINLSLLPQYSFLLRFTFTLEKPYISRDEQEFYIIDNPIRKDKVFGLPYVAPSSWKGSLRAALWQLDHKAEDDEIRRIFGNERGAEEHEKLRAGRLHLFPTFFTKKGLEIINPHDRKRRVGTVPILMESVPEEANGFFTLLYVPFDLIGKEEETIKKQVAEDIPLITKGLNAMFRDYGFGAKTSSGYGIVKPDLADGTITLRAYGVEASQKEIEKPKRPEEAFQKYLNEDGSVKAEFKGSGGAGLLSRTEYGEKGKQLGGGGRNEFRDFRQWYGVYGEQWQKYLKSRDAPAPEWPIWTFTNFEELMKLAERIENSLRSREESQ